MLKLNLPPYDHQVVRKNNKLYIFDRLRHKYVYLTPEEWVRQHFVHLLIGEYKYPPSLIKAESSLRYNQLPKRADLLVFDRAGQPFLLVECKDTGVPLDDVVLQQAVRYNRVIGARYLVLVNGLEWQCYEADLATGALVLMSDLPPFSPAELPS
ncbi:MAG: type I restriction enzyme HsdR N-terminal domain-containing protein [Cytophagales bacterium]|nr:type I restriction enzyme HsdR N-terminal domain-containing protein [Cytophagales bacterium]